VARSTDERKIKCTQDFHLRTLWEENSWAKTSMAREGLEPAATVYEYVTCLALPQG
jgi:hypothetical protein